MPRRTPLLTDAEKKARRCARLRKRYKEDAEHRKRLYERQQQFRATARGRELQRISRRKCQAKPEVREKRRTRERERLASDPEYRAKRNALQRRYLDDPTYREGINARRRLKYAANPEHVCKQAREKREADVNIRLAHVLRNRLRSVLRQRQIKRTIKVGSAVRDLGCTLDEFRTYIETRWQSGMTWLNYGRGEGTWSIDHLRPLAAFDLTNREHWLQACHYTNLGPLWSDENHGKCDRLPDGTLGRHVRRALITAKATLAASPS